MHRCKFVLLWAVPMIVPIVAAAQIAAPQVGFLHTDDGQVRPVRGLTASFVLGDALERGAVSASFSDAGGVILDADQVRILDRQGPHEPNFSPPEASAVTLQLGDVENLTLQVRHAGFLASADNVEVQLYVPSGATLSRRLPKPPPTSFPEKTMSAFNILPNGSALPAPADPPAHHER